MVTFTDAYIKSLKPKTSRYLIRESAPRGEGGFCIRVMPTGKKSWQMVYSFEGARKWFHLGDYPSLSLTNARKKFRQMKEILANGQDPGETTRKHLQERRDAWTVDHLCDEFLKKYCFVKKRPRSAREDDLNLKRDVRKAWGARKAADIGRGDVKILIDEIASRGAGTQANRTLATIRKMFSWAMELEVVNFNPAQGISKPTTETPKDRTLSNEEIIVFWNALSQKENNVPNPVKKALKLILLTGMRPGEIIGAKWEQINDRWLELPSTSTKNKISHRTYLSDQVLAEVGPDTEEYLIARNEIARLEVYTLSAWIRSRNYFGLKPWSPHDLRRTCATKLAELGTLPHILRQILNHKPTGITAQVYDKYQYSDEIRIALSKFGSYIDKLTNTKLRQDP